LSLLGPVVSGVAPHVLHHVGPLAGAALLAGFGGKAIFFALGLLLSVPMLRRLYRRRRGSSSRPATPVITREVGSDRRRPARDVDRRLLRRGARSG
jgi:hypothetical protein